MKRNSLNSERFEFLKRLQIISDEPIAENIERLWKIENESNYGENSKNPKVIQYSKSYNQNMRRTPLYFI